MSLRTQSKVLRVLEEQRIEPIGSGQTMTVDVRVLAATNKNLETGNLAWRFPPGSFLPPQCDSLFRSAASRPRQKTSPRSPTISCRNSASPTAKRSANSATRPWTFCCVTPGPATSANFAISSSAWSSSVRKPASSRTTYRLSFSAASPRARTSPTTRCTKPAAPTNANLF